MDRTVKVAITLSQYVALSRGHPSKLRKIRNLGARVPVISRVKKPDSTECALASGNARGCVVVY